jgi:hemolysin III
MDERDYLATQIANISAPALGLLLAIPGFWLLLERALREGDGWQIGGCLAYGISLVLAYAAFTSYHIFKFHRRWGTLFKIFDHSAIYLLIAGTYTPFTLVFLRGHWGWTLFATVWGVTVCGILFKSYFIHRFKVLGPLLYLGMGWLLLLVIKPALVLIPAGGLWLLLAGGLWYSVGLIFYAWQRLPYHHAIWHLFVFAGSLCHYLAIYRYVLA